MFEVPKEKENLMNEYKSLVVRKLTDEKSKRGDKSFLKNEDFVKAISPLSVEDLVEMVYETPYPVYGDKSYYDLEMFKDFVESRIGEDFIVFEGLEEKVFCLHTVEDYVSKYIFLDKEESITNKERFYEKNKAS